MWVVSQEGVEEHCGKGSKGSERSDLYESEHTHTAHSTLLPRITFLHDMTDNSKHLPETHIKCICDILVYKREWNNVIFISREDLEIIIPSEVRKRKTNTIWYHLYVESKIWRNWTHLQNRKRLTGIENRPVVVKEEGVSRRDGVGVSSQQMETTI